MKLYQPGFIDGSKFPVWSLVAFYHFPTLDV